MSEKISLRPNQVQLIEELAHIHEMMGLQPAMAKVLALLTVSDDVELTFDQVKDTLDLSKSAISQTLNQLLLTKKISYKTKIGDRKRYFHVRVSDWETQIMEQFNVVSSLVNINQKILDSRPPKTKDFNTSLKEMNDFLSVLHNQVLSLHKKFQQDKK